MAVDIALESVDTLLTPEVHAMTVAHLAGASPLASWKQLDADVDMFKACEKLGSFFVMVARREGNVVGYSGTFITRHRFQRHSIFANNDMLFVLPEFRSTHVTLRLMRATVQEAKRRGAAVMGWAAHPGSPLGRMLARTGHVVAESLYLREI